MNHDVKKVWHRLEYKRILLMQDLSKFENNHLNKKPQPEKWSANQVIMHLMNAEATSLAYMKKKLSHTSNLPKAGFKSKLRRLMLNVAFVLPLKYKAPPVLAESLPTESDFDNLKLSWASQRLEMLNFLEALPENVVKSEIWNHPVVGKMNIVQMIDFFDDHVDRHKKQIFRTLQSAN